MKIGFIGLGIMGRPMALHLKQAGHDLFIPERASLTPELRAAASVLPDAAAVAGAAEVVILMLPDTPDVEAVLFGARGVAEGLNPGTLVIDMSSISPTATKDFAARIRALGCDYLDAPVSGGEVGAKNASLTIMVGGPQAAFDRATPLFQAMGKNITLVGEENGAGQTCKARSPTRSSSR
ncbi:NAD(P)-dependent oxidoreductase [Teichococcus cervicalis]